MQLRSVDDRVGRRLEPENLAQIFSEISQVRIWQNACSHVCMYVCVYVCVCVEY